MIPEEEKLKNMSDPVPPSSGKSGTSKTYPASLPPAGKTLASGRQQFLISPRRLGALGAMPVQPLAFNLLEQTLKTSPDVEVMDTIGPRGLVGTLADGMAGPPTVIVARMTAQTAEILYQQGRGELIVEPDHLLALAAGVTLQPGMVFGSAPAGSPASPTILVTGPDNSPVEGAEVYVLGSLALAMGVTDQRGQVRLSLLGETPQSIRGIYVKPRFDFWSFYQCQPSLDTTQPNIVILKPLSSTFPNFPRQQVTGWGQKAMRLDQLPPNYRGQGTKIAVLDSGAATTHSDLQKISLGFDALNKKANSKTWHHDTVAHGSHCAGVIAGDPDNGTGIRGIAPDAEIHVCKVFPAGQVSNLIDALEYCIEHQIDVVNLSLGTYDPSEILEEHLLRARRLGIACIVAAGNSGGPVQYPASSPNVLAVGAIGKIGEFPQDSYHAQTVPGMAVAAGGYFSPKFTCFGPEIGVCGPGVAILSSVPPDNFAVWDGTSLAASHISALAALVLAHHPEFRGPFRTRDAARVDRLFQILKSSAQPLSFLDPRRTGFGVPDALVALGLAPPSPAALLRTAATSLPGTFVPPAGQPFAPQGIPAPFPGWGVDPFIAACMQQAQASIWPQGGLGNTIGQFGGPVSGIFGTSFPGPVGRFWF